MRWYYNGFSFDGETSVYNPFSVLNFLQKCNFGEYWFESGSPSYIVNYVKEKGLNDPEEFRSATVLSNFTTVKEIESAEPESLLFQAGYLTIKEKREKLDYAIIKDGKPIIRFYFNNPKSWQSDCTIQAKKKKYSSIK